MGSRGRAAAEILGEDVLEQPFPCCLVLFVYAVGGRTLHWGQERGTFGDFTLFV